MVRVLVLVAIVAGLARTTRAERFVHAGLDVRTDLGTHHTRVPLGMRTGAWDVTLVVDPMVALDGQHDLDALGAYFVTERAALLFGWRWSLVDVSAGVHQQQRSLIGITGVGPELFDRRLRTAFALELATLWVKHGGGSETDWISFDRNLHDSISLGLFVRFEYAHAL